MTDPLKKGQIGLANLGNTCYLNAPLQCLRHVPDLTVFFHKHSDSWIHKESDANANLCRGYKQLIKDLWSGTAPGYLKPGGFLRYFREALKGTMVEYMIAPQQHDSHEALVFLLDQLHEGMKRALNINVMAEEGTAVYNALTAWKEQVAPEYSPIVDYFFGLMEVSVTCSVCQNVRCRYEPFSMLNVDFPNSKEATLEQCIDYAFEPEPFDEYECEKCWKRAACSSHELFTDSCTGCKAIPKPQRHPGTVQRRIWRLPQNLILVVKRFRYETQMTKCNANFTANTSQKFEKWFTAASPESSRVADYSLQSIVDHHGVANGGHYTAQVKSPVTELWNMYDDETVRQLGDGTKPHFGAMSYILFYRKV